MGLFDMSTKRMTLSRGIELAQSTPHAVLLDVRTVEEFEQGHLPGSVNLPVNRIQSIAFDKQIPLFVYCQSGMRSGRACSYLQQVGYTATNIGGLAGYQGTLESGRTT